MQDASIRIEPFFLETPRGPLFCLYTAPSEKVATMGVLYLHPFAEEMHKSRRMAAIQARALAHAGYAVLQVDLTGCGDSAGEFGDATWDIWLDDVRLAHAWLSAQVSGSIILWGLRTGASLAAFSAPSFNNISLLVLWQPVANGDQFLNQFLRIKLASEMLGEGQAQTGTKNLRMQLAANEFIEVGGYLLSPGLARGLAELKLSELRPSCPVAWLEVGAHASDHIAPAGQQVVETWREAGTKVFSQTVLGEPFWATQEIAESAALIEATIKATTQ